MICRNCHQETGDEVLVDLGMQPLANSLGWHPHQHLNSFKPCDICEKQYPLAPVICQNGHCRLIQLPELPGGVGFGADYPYRSGQSESWKLHLRDLVERSGVRAGQNVYDIGGNDGTLGTLLPYGTAYVNVDPSAPGGDSYPFTREVGEHFAAMADYVFALNVAAHVPDLDDFFAGIHALLKPMGKLVVEVQDVNRLIEQGAWDCIYHEHYSYFNKQTLADAIERRGFYVEKYEDIPTHGGSIRLTAHKIEQRLLDHPLHRQPLRLPKPYPTWPIHPYIELNAIRRQFSAWKRDYKRIVGYGAPAKANTWLNYIGQCNGTFDYICDTTPEKQGRYTPGSHVPIVGPDRLAADTPDVIVVLCWNWIAEVLPKLQAHIDRGVEIWCRGEQLR